jgi:hypothetical protein
MASERKAGMSRRRFLKATAGALALGAAPTIIIPRRVEAYQPGGRIHPNIDPLRVVGLTDARMTTGLRDMATWQQTRGLFDAEIIAANMDRLAMALTEESNADDAWRGIFVKPPGKDWSDTVVAIKTNQIAQMRTSPPVMRKVCRMLTDVVGIRGSNIFIYDGCHGSNSRWGSSIREENHFADLPEGVQLADTWGGCRAFQTRVPEPYLNGTQRRGCVPHFITGRVDILVNIALCKGHGVSEVGGFTMCMKNHLGTFDPMPVHRDGGGTDYLMAINKTPEILGRMDPTTGDVLYPRQQLCIVDALWATSSRAADSADAQPNALFMGAFPPVTDYVLAMRFRKEKMGWALNEEVMPRFLADFWYTAEDLPNGGQIADALAASA